MAKDFIKGAIGKPGALRASLGTPAGQPIPKTTLKEAASKPGKMGERARLAITLAGLGNKKGARADGGKKPAASMAERDRADKAADKKAGIKQGSKADLARDKKAGVYDYEYGKGKPSGGKAGGGY